MFKRLQLELPLSIALRIVTLTFSATLIMENEYSATSQLRKKSINSPKAWGLDTG